MKSFVILIAVFFTQIDAFGAVCAQSAADRAAVAQILAQPECHLVRPLVQQLSGVCITDLSDFTFTRFEITGTAPNGQLATYTVMDRVMNVVGAFGGGGMQTYFWCSEGSSQDQ